MPGTTLMTKRVLTSLGITLLCMQGCATILRGDSELLFVETYPKGALIAVNGQVRGVSPTTIMLDRGYGRPLVEAWLPGYRLESVQPLRGIDGSGVGFLILDFFVSPLIGLSVDLASGNLCAFQDPQLSFELQTGDDPAPSWAWPREAGAAEDW